MEKVLEYIYYPSLSFALSWIVTSQFYAVLDLWQPKWYQDKCCSKKEDYKPMTLSVYFHLLQNNIMNLLIALITYASMVYLRNIWTEYPLFIWLPNPYRWVVEFIGCYLWAEIWFYSGHKMLHDYKMSWHTKHHEYDTYLYSMVSQYCNPEEQLFLNIPLGIGFGVLAYVQSSVLTTWLGLLGWHIANNHSCHWLVPLWMDDPAYHLKHHRFNINHGAQWVRMMFEKVRKIKSLF